MKKEKSKKPLEEVEEDVLDLHSLIVDQVTSNPKRLHMRLCSSSSSETEKTELRDLICFP